MQKAIKIDPNKEILLSIGEAADYLGVSIDTLRRWEKKDKIIALRSPGGHRYFKQKDLDNLFGRKYERKKEEEPRKIEKKVEIQTHTEDKLKPVERPVIQELPERQPREVDIPPLSPIKVISDQPSPFQTQTESLGTKQAQVPLSPPTQSSVLTPPAITAKPQQVAPISSVPPAAQYNRKVVKKKSNAWIYLIFGLALLIVGFTIFVIFRSPPEVISPVP
jgi:excisionase family DNA binding protein